MSGRLGGLLRMQTPTSSDLPSLNPMQLGCWTGPDTGHHQLGGWARDVDFWFSAALKSYWGHLWNTECEAEVRSLVRGTRLWAAAILAGKAPSEPQKTGSRLNKHGLLGQMCRPTHEPAGPGGPLSGYLGSSVPGWAERSASTPGLPRPREQRPGGFQDPWTPGFSTHPRLPCQNAFPCAPNTLSGHEWGQDGAQMGSDVSQLPFRIRHPTWQWG